MFSCQCFHELGRETPLSSFIYFTHPMVPMDSRKKIYFFLSYHCLTPSQPPLEYPTLEFLLAPYPLISLVSFMSFENLAIDVSFHTQIMCFRCPDWTLLPLLFSLSQSRPSTEIHNCMYVCVHACICISYMYVGMIWCMWFM